jgi:hypothetical protein
MRAGSVGTIPYRHQKRFVGLGSRRIQPDELEYAERREAGMAQGFCQT